MVGLDSLTQEYVMSAEPRFYPEVNFLVTVKKNIAEKPFIVAIVTRMIKKKFNEANALDPDIAHKSYMGMLKKAASLRQGYGRQASGSMPAEAASRRQVALLPCSRTESTLRASKGLRPCWTNFFEHSLPLTREGLSRASMGYGPEIFNRPI